jgi:hypothetical protein
VWSSRASADRIGYGGVSVAIGADVGLLIEGEVDAGPLAGQQDLSRDGEGASPAITWVWIWLKV